MKTAGEIIARRFFETMNENEEEMLVNEGGLAVIIDCSIEYCEDIKSAARPLKTAVEKLIDDFIVHVQGIEFTHEQASRLIREIVIRDRIPNSKGKD